MISSNLISKPEEKPATTPAQANTGDAKLTTGVNLFKPKGPEYTIRMLLGNVHSESKEVPTLKPFSHFTLGCTHADESAKITDAFDKLTTYFKGSVIFKPEAVINLGSEAQPLWALRLNLGSKEAELRATLSELFDSVMSAERNGVVYLWQSTEASQKKCPHLTIGPRKEDYETAEKLLQANCEFQFNQLDYKKLGPKDPHISRKLELEINPRNSL